MATNPTPRLHRAVVHEGTTSQNVDDNNEGRRCFSFSSLLHTYVFSFYVSLSLSPLSGSGVVRLLVAPQSFLISRPIVVVTDDDCVRKV